MFKRFIRFIVKRFKGADRMLLVEQLLTMLELEQLLKILQAVQAHIDRLSDERK